MSSPQSAFSADRMYQGPAPWVIGEPQPALLRLIDSGVVRGRVVDIGCGAGELTVAMADRGIPAVGIDAASAAIAMAETNARRRNVSPCFKLVDVLDGDGVAPYRDCFDTAVDCGTLHSLPASAHPSYRHSILALLRPGGVLHVLVMDVSARALAEASMRRAGAPRWAFAEFPGMRQIDLLQALGPELCSERIVGCAYKLRFGSSTVSLPAWLGRFRAATQGA